MESTFQRKFSVAGAEVGGEHLALIAGPCVIESAEMCLNLAQEVKRVAADLGLPLVFKSSYVKANRTSARSFRGPGLEEGLRILAEVRDKVGVPVLSDVHAVDEVEAAARVLDVLQVPAFLCRQSELVEACARTGKPVNVKKGQFLAPEDTRHILDKLSLAGAKRVMLTERGSCFGYHNLVVDMRGITTMRGFGVPVAFDVTHSLQTPGGERTGGDRRFAGTLARAAVAAGCDALFVETHHEPEKALSDSGTMMPLSELKRFLEDMVKLRRAYLACSSR
ncbi:MAG: 3-deoxy-8-phosphooctulonate synthase [Candidatus Eisenbacteria bacterium]|nr:3-deoxy-8-phosphooctulonate synthase [Candidatus Eisenbacteria bacterium]